MSYDYVENSTNNKWRYSNQFKKKQNKTNEWEILHSRLKII